MSDKTKQCDRKNGNYRLGARISEVVAKHNKMTITSLLKAIGMSSANYYSLLERDDVKASVLIRLSEVLDLPLSVWFEHLDVSVKSDNLVRENKAGYMISEFANLQECQVEVSRLRKHIIELQDQIIKAQKG